MKPLILFTIFCLFSTQFFAQVGIGTNTPHSSAKLEVSSTTQGFLPPRVSLTATNAATPVTSPETGLLVYNIATASSSATAVTPGYYYWSGLTGWVRLIVPTDNAANVTGTVAVTNGGTGATTLTGILKGNGSSAFTTALAGTDYQAALTNPVTGTGTSNYLPKFNGSTTVENSQIFDNSTSVGIGVNTPNASAKLEINSTTQGFLPPRMNNTAIDAISSPARGLIVFCTDCGNNGELQVYNGQAWTNMLGGNRSPAIGSSYGGGVLAYLLQPGDQGYDPNVLHGLIAATTDQSTGITWNKYSGQSVQTNASGWDIGTGLSNTTAIIAAQVTPTTSYAAGVASEYISGNFTGWYLPSKAELNKLYLNKTLIGGFDSSANYWSSSEHASIVNHWDSAHFQDFSNGSQGTTYRETICRVRAIRSF